MSKNNESSYPCVCCGLSERGMVCYHHLLTQKAHPGHALEKWNKISVCQKHHNEFHNMGITYMANKYSGVKIFLESHDWEILSGKYRHDLNS